MSTVWYTTREAVKAALDYRETSRSDAQVDRAIETASRAIEGLLHRKFYPWTGTRYLDWPNRSSARAGRLWLDANELASLTSMTSGGVVIPPASRLLRRSDGVDAPPYTHIELNLGTSAAFGIDLTSQQSIALTGVFIGCPLDEQPAGALAAAIVSTSATAITVTNGSALGVGSILRCDTERLLVTGRTLTDTAQDLGADLAANNAVVTVPVTTGALYFPREVITIDAERMRIEDVAGNSLIVRRAWDGSVLATHAAGADIYAPRALTVERGALGTTAATHLIAAPLAAHIVPAPVETLAVGMSIVELLGEASGHSRTVGEGESAREATGRGLAALRKDAITACGRQARKRAV